MHQSKFYNCAKIWYNKRMFTGIAEETGKILTIRENDIEIEFGKIRLKFDKKKLDTDEVLNALERIHIKVRKNEETGEYKIYYNDEPIDLYVRE